MILADRVDAATAYAVTHEFDKVIPHDIKLRATHVAAGTIGVDARSVESLRAVDVAYSGEDGLIHEQGADGRATARDPPPGTLGVGILANRIRTDAIRKHPHLIWIQDLTGGRPPQIGVGATTLESQAHLTHGRWSLTLGERPLAVEPEVDMQCPHLIEVHETMLAQGIGAMKCRAIQERRTFIKAPLRTRHHRGLTTEGALDPTSLAVYDVTLRHALECARLVMWSLS